MKPKARPQVILITFWNHLLHPTRYPRVADAAPRTTRTCPGAGRQAARIVPRQYENGAEVMSP